MTGGIGPTDIDIDIDIDIGTGGTPGSGGPGTPVRPIGVSPALDEQAPEDWYRGNKWPPTDLPRVFRNAPGIARDFPLPPWTAEFYSIVVIGELVGVSIPPALLPAGVVPIAGAANPLTWAAIALPAIPAAAAVVGEIAQLIKLIEYRPAVFSEARRQVDRVGVIGYFRGILSFTPESHPWTFGLAVIALRVGEFQAMHYKAKFNRPRPSTLSPALMPPIEVPGHAAYPSGHSTQSYLAALCLAEVMPPAANQAQGPGGVNHPEHGPLQRVAERISRNREVLGLHYPSDSAAGKLLAERTFLLLKECDTVKDIIALAEAEWV